ncbi:MAG: hypothetical protein J6Y20_02525 [Lachnospiraceae bacterium]|nr:hypothetical protein [Lachnospiraceae bacterium]
MKLISGVLFLTEDEYVKFYDRFREETYMLAESGRNYTDEDVRAMYKKRVIQAQFTHNCGMFRAGRARRNRRLRLRDHGTK